MKEADAAHRGKARSALVTYLTAGLKWNARTAALMLEYASNRFQQPEDVIVVSGGFGGLGAFTSASWPNDRTPTQMTYANLGPLRAIGEQKATQFFAQLASAFDPRAGSTYEAIFAAWGGDVRERSVDLKTGKVRPREITVEPSPAADGTSTGVRPVAAPGSDWSEYPADPTVYARVDYLDPMARITEAEKASCRNVLKNLDVVFTFAPMNLLHYKVQFPPNSTQTLTIQYKQYAYADTREPASYQLAYVVHPASLWDSFGPIDLYVAVPAGVAARASVPTQEGGLEERDVSLQPWDSRKEKAILRVHRAIVTNKKGELFVAVDAASWRTRYPIEGPDTPRGSASAAVPKAAPSPSR